MLRGSTKLRMLPNAVPDVYKPSSFLLLHARYENDFARSTAKFPHNCNVIHIVCNVQSLLLLVQEVRVLHGLCSALLEKVQQTDL